MAITWTDVANIDPALATLPAGTQTAVLSFVGRFLNAGSWGTSLDDGTLFLAAHLGALILRGGGLGSTAPLSSERVGDVQRTYSNVFLKAGIGNLDATVWGQQYKALCQALFGGGMVI